MGLIHYSTHNFSGIDQAQSTGIEKHSEYPSMCMRAASKWTKQAIVFLFLPSFPRKISDSLLRGLVTNTTSFYFYSRGIFFPSFLKSLFSFLLINKQIHSNQITEVQAAKPDAAVVTNNSKWKANNYINH